MACVYDYVEILTQMQEALARGLVVFAKDEIKNRGIAAYLLYMRRAKNRRLISDDVKSIEEALLENERGLKNASTVSADVIERRREATARSMQALARIKQELDACQALVKMKKSLRKMKKRTKKYYFTSKKHRMGYEQRRIQVKKESP